LFFHGRGERMVAQRTQNHRKKTPGARGVVEDGQVGKTGPFSTAGPFGGVHRQKRKSGRNFSH